MEIIEQYLVPKSGDQGLCEDGVVFTKSFAAVVDGATTSVAPASPSARTRPSLGRIARDVLCQAIVALPRDITPDDAAIALNRAIRQRCEADHTLSEARTNPDLRPVASVIIYSAERNEIWSIGDCVALIDGTTFRRESKVELIAAEVRSIVLHAAILDGADATGFLTTDPGRTAIEPLIRASRRFRNSNVMSEYRVVALDGFAPLSSALAVTPVPSNSTEVVLASDGYPVVRPTLAESERELALILDQDPLCYRLFRATKGKYRGQLSFDDRCYLRIAIHAHQKK